MSESLNQDTTARIFVRLRKGPYLREYNVKLTGYFTHTVSICGTKQITVVLYEMAASIPHFTLVSAVAYFCNLFSNSTKGC